MTQEKKGAPGTGTPTNQTGYAGQAEREYSTTECLTATHHQALKQSALTDDVIAERGYRTITNPDELARIGFTPGQRRMPGLLLPVHSTDGSNPFSAYRPDDPRVFEDKSGKRNPDGTWPNKVIKYEVPKGTSIRLDCPPRSLHSLGDPGVPLWITEGQKKADALASAGLCAVALLGVWNFKGKNNRGGTTFLADWDYIALNNRAVRIVFDSDVMTKPQVRQALDSLTEHLQRKGAHVDAVYLSPLPGQGKVGVDDWLAAGHTVAELEALIEAPRPVLQPAPASVELLDDAPPTISRPVAMIDGRAYAAVWPYTRTVIPEEINKKTGEVMRYTHPRIVQERRLFIIRDDGMRFGDAAIQPLSELAIDIRLPEVPVQRDKLWSTPGIKDYCNGYRPTPVDVFKRLVGVVSHFIDFEQSIADQNTMAEMIACFILSTWMLETASVSGALWLNGEKGCGKTQLLLLICELSHLGMAITTSSSAASVRDLAEYGATLGHDDAEMLTDPEKSDPEIRALLLAGNRRGVTVTLKEQGTNGQWVTRVVNAFCPKVFSSIQKPDDVLSSRVIILPLVKTPDRRRANADPLDPRQWPHDRRALIDDLWALSLSHLPSLPHYDSVVGDRARIIGRDLQPWRGLLAVAAWLNDNGAPGLWERMESLASEKYQSERGGLEVADVVRVIVMALLELAAQSPSAREWKLSTEAIVNAMKTIIEAREIDLNPGNITARSIGRRLSKMRLREDPSAKPRGRIISRRTVNRLAIAYKMQLPPELEEPGGNSVKPPPKPAKINEDNEGDEDNEVADTSLSSFSSSSSLIPAGGGESVINTRPCFLCGGNEWWRRQDGDLVCDTCHPNPNPERL